MGKQNRKKTEILKYPFVSICTPTFNRRPFIPIIIKCFENQDYPKDRMEWIIVDDGSDKIEDLVAHLPLVKYLKYDQKMTIGKKRNITNDAAKGDIIVYMDDDDYYPPDRVSHAVSKLTSCKALCAGSSLMYLHFKHINKLYSFGPYGPNHATAATFAFKRELLKQTRFDETSAVAEERKFLKDYTIPFVQLDSTKTILVFSHNQNSFDKKELLKQMPNPMINETLIQPKDIVKEPDLLKFFMEDIDGLLEKYEPGNIIHKPDVIKQIETIKIEREKKIQELMKQQQSTMNNPNNPQLQQHLNQQAVIIQQLTDENKQLKEKIEYMNKKIRELIAMQIEKRKAENNDSTTNAAANSTKSDDEQHPPIEQT